MILHADGESVRRNGGRAGVETFVVGCDVGKGERLQWVVEGGRYKANFLLPDRDDERGRESEGLLISEVSFSWFECGCEGLYVIEVLICRLSCLASSIENMTFYAPKRWTDYSPPNKHVNCTGCLEQNISTSHRYIP